MLKGIDPVLGPELLAILRGMGHGDEIAVVDGNYPAETDAAIRTLWQGAIDKATSRRRSARRSA